MKRFIVTTEQKTANLESVTESLLQIDFEDESFSEETKLFFSDGFSVESKLKYEQGVFYLDDQAVETSTEKWVNNSANLICLAVFLAEAPASSGGNQKVRGDITQLNQLLEGQLNLEELGQDSVYEFILKEKEPALKMKLTILNPQGEALMTQTVQEQ